MQNTATPSSLALLSPQRFNKPLAARPRPAMHSDTDLQGNAPTKHLVRSAEITFATDPQRLIARAVNVVAAEPLRNFLRSVLAERDVNRVLTLLSDENLRFQRLPIDRLRAAAETASHTSLQAPRARDTLYAAVLIAGIECLLGETVQPPYSTTDIIRSVVREPLRQLDGADSAQAHALRNCLGWGSAEEACNPRTQTLQHQVITAVQSLRNHRILARYVSQTANA